jgi:hypothetical protein
MMESMTFIKREESETAINNKGQQNEWQLNEDEEEKSLN